MLANWTGDVLYTGLTNDLDRRLSEHRNGYGSKFAQKYNCFKLVYFEHYYNITDAKHLETQIKGWRREKKDVLVNALNPVWRDLSEEWYGSKIQKIPHICSGSQGGV